jgi:glutamyl-tRNA synthetase
MPDSITRLAPSPTGALHLGNARTFLVNWLMAKQNNWRIILRIEDLDGPRIKRGADQQAIEDLQWLGLDWNEGPIYQSSRMHLYEAAIKKLLELKLAYPCICSRKETALAASAPHAEDGASVYPGTCRDRFRSVEEAQTLSGKPPTIRFRTPDDFALGDFVIAKSDGTAAYQLAVVVDDADMNVTHIVRGDDLLDSTPRQMFLYRALGLENRIPSYTHLPLVIGTDGRRLAKRHGDTRISHYREMGVSAGRVRALLARWCDISSGDEISIEQMSNQFDLTRIGRDPIIMTPEDDAWLRALRSPLPPGEG